MRPNYRHFDPLPKGRGVPRTVGARLRWAVLPWRAPRSPAVQPLPNPTQAAPLESAAGIAPGGAWTGRLWLRMRRHFLIKLVGISLFMWVFFIGYFHLLRNPTGPVLTMPLTALDRAIPFTPGALALYLSLWFYVGIAPGLMLRLRDLVAFGAWAAALCGAGLACFYLLPTAVPPQPLEIDLAQHPAFVMLQGVDASGNACPSLHVATAVFAALWIEHLLRLIGAPAFMRLVNLLWVLLIVWSTLAVKQHVVIDVVSGALLGSAFAMAALRWRPRP